ncbi:MAG: hypothetical protein GY814_01250 [Gammaproteobacteria bacterium]|nr:hypothetical protein [Gammaproteobacteria bacterium]
MLQQNRGQRGVACYLLLLVVMVVICGHVQAENKSRTEPQGRVKSTSIVDASKALDSNNYQLSLQLTNRILVHQPKNMQAHWIKGLSLLGLNRYQESLQQLEMVADAQPENRKIANFITKVKAQVAKHAPTHSVQCETTGRDSQFGPFRLCASSVLTSQNGNHYGPGSALDFDERSAWVEGVEGSGAGQWLELNLGGGSSFQTLFLVNGYAKNRTTFNANGRLRMVRIQAADGLDTRITLKDSMEQQEIRLPRRVTSPWIRLTIISVYPGSRWQDTAISELAVDLEEFNYQTEAGSGDTVQKRSGDYLSEEQALDRVMAVEEIRAWADKVARADSGIKWRTEQAATAHCQEGNCLWCFRLQEDLGSHSATFGIYCIDGHTHDISKIDPITEKSVPVQATIP